MADAGERFWSKVDVRGSDDCWPWLGYIGVGGYGVYGARENRTKAHRFAYRDHHGTNPGELFVCHRCDNPPCCNPKHLFLGTAADNMADRDAKGRQARGERQAKAKLRGDQVSTIRELYATGRYTQASIARVYGVTQVMVSRIVRCADWRHVA